MTDRTTVTTALATIGDTGWATIPGYGKSTFLADVDFGASPSKSGTYNSGAIAAAHIAAAVAGGTVLLSTPGIYLLNGSPPVIGSNVSFIGPGGRAVILRNDPANGAYRPMLVTPNVSPTTGLGIAGAAVTITSSGSTATMTWAAHGKTVGDHIGVAGANETGYIGVFRVETTADANTLTYFCDEAPSATPATGTISAWTATVNVRVEGLTFDYNNTALSGVDANTRHAIITAHCFNPQFINMRMENVSKYAIYPVNSKDLWVERLELQTASDGLHIGGVSGATVTQVSGYSGDDFLAFLSAEGPGSQYNLGAWHKFPHRGVDVRKVVPRNSGAACVKITGNDHPYRDFTFDQMYGSCASNYFTIAEDTGAFALTGAPNIDSIKATNCRPVNFQSTGKLFSILANTLNTSGVIKRFEVSKSGYVGQGGQTFMLMGSGGTGTYTINDLIFDDCDVDPTIQTSNTGGISVNSKGVVGTLHMTRLRNSGVNANFKWLLNDGAIGAIHADQSTMPNGNGFLISMSSTGTGNTDIHLNNINTQCTNNPISMQHGAGRTVNVFSKNWRHRNSTAISLNGAGTTNLYGEILTTNAPVGIAGGAVVNNQMERSVQAVAFAAAITPDLGLGCILNIALLTGTITINNPSNVPASGVEVVVNFLDGGAVADVVTWGANWIFATAWTTVGQAAGKKSSLTFKSDGTKMIAQSANSWY